MKNRGYFIFIFFILFAAVAQADIVSYMDKNGQEWFVNDVSRIPAQYRGQAETVITGKEKPPKVSSHQKKGFFESLKEKWSKATKEEEEKTYTRPKKTSKKKYTYKKKRQYTQRAKKKDDFEKKQDKIRERLTYKPQTLNDKFEPGRRHSKGSY